MRAEQAKRSLRKFVVEAWHVLEPQTAFVPGWHLDAICDHLQAVTEGRIRKLLINVPPRHMKSLATSVFWPCWTWTFKPWIRWMFASYGLGLSIRDSLKCRRLIRSPWYQSLFKNSFQLAGDQNQKSRYENTEGGLRLATSVGGMGTGEGGDIIVIDDAHNVNDVESKVVREGVIRWYDETMSTRGNNPNAFAEVLIMQRVHEQDLSGHVLEQGGWTHLCLPAEFEKERKCVTVVDGVRWEDPRTKEGELLWPSQFGREHLKSLKRKLGIYGAAGQLQQSPVPPGGGIIKKPWLRYFTFEPGGKHVRLGNTVLPIESLYRFLVCDPAVTEKEEADFTVIGSFGVVIQNPPLLLMLDRVKEQMEGPKIIPAIDSMKLKWRAGFTAFETIAFQKAIFQDARRRGRSFREVSYALDALVRIDKDKVARTYAAAPFVEAGRFWVPAQGEADWTDDFVKNLTHFPKMEHDDDVDVADIAIAIAEKKEILRSLSAQKTLVVGEDHDVEEDPLPGDEDDDASPDDRRADEGLLKGW